MFQETYPLLLSDKPFKGITIYMFSEGINTYNKDLQGVQIVENDLAKKDIWEYNGTRAAVQIVNGFKKVFEGDHAKTKLRIVNMEPLAGRKFPQNFTDISTVNGLSSDIIYLPQIEAPACKEVLKSLFELRKKHVCITAAKRECSELVAAECIAIGVKDHSDHMILSGVLTGFCARLCRM